MPVVCNICAGASQKCTFVNRDLYPGISGWPTINPAPKDGWDDDSRPKRRTTRAKGKKVAAAPALEVRSVSERGTSSSSSYLHPNDSRGFGVTHRVHRKIFEVRKPYKNAYKRTNIMHISPLMDIEIKL